MKKMKVSTKTTNSSEHKETSVSMFYKNTINESLIEEVLYNKTENNKLNKIQKSLYKCYVSSFDYELIINF